MNSEFVELSLDLVEKLRQLGYEHLAADEYTELDGDAILGKGATTYYSHILFRQAIPIRPDESFDEHDSSIVPLEYSPKLRELIDDDVNWYHIHKKYLAAE